jgi:uncharacterized membrane protein
MSGLTSILAAAYEDVVTARAEYHALEGAYKHVGTSLDFDATVFTRDDDGQVQIVERHDALDKEGTASGLGWGLAAGAIAALFPAIGIVSALAVGGGAGALIGHLTHKASSGISRENLKALGDVLDQGRAGMVVVYGPDMADRVSGSITQASATVRRTTDISVEELAAALREREAATS